jgi:hypothetical protein
MRRAQIIIAAAGIISWTLMLGAGIGPRWWDALWLAGSVFALTEAVTRGRHMNSPGSPVTAWQWLALPKAERRARAGTFREAGEALQASGDAERALGIDWETSEYAVLSHRVNYLWPTVPWWVRSPALPHPSSRRSAALYALAAVAVLAVVAMIALTGCSDPCSGHGGVSYGPVSGWYYCNDGTVQ